MNGRSLILFAALATLVGGGMYHRYATHVQANLERERGSMAAEAVEKRRLAREEARRAAAAKKELEAVLARRASHEVSGPNTAYAPGTGAAPGPASPPVVLSPELRRLEIQAVVSDQRLRFGALFARLGFTPEKQQAFDRIIGAYEEVRRYETSTERQREAGQVREAQLRQLFGADYGHYIAAGLNQPARTQINQIVTQTFQSSGALSTAQADELTMIAARHRLPPTATRYPGQSEFDWDRILADAQAILTEQQRKDFSVAIDYRRANAQMTAITAKHNPRTALP